MDASLDLTSPSPASAVEHAGKTLPTIVCVFEQMQTTPYGDNLRRMVLEGVNRSGYELELHLTELAPGSEPHPPHRHEHEEIVMLQRGLVDATIEGKTTRLTPGSVVYVAANEFHGWRNAGTEPSIYFIIALKFVPF